MTKKKDVQFVLGKIASSLAEIINKRGWFTKEQKKKLEQALELMDTVLAQKIKETWKGGKGHD